MSMVPNYYEQSSTSAKYIVLWNLDFYVQNKWQKVNALQSKLQHWKQKPNKMSKRGKGSLKMMSQPDNKDSSLGPIKGNSPLLQKDSEQRKNKLKPHL